MGVLIFTLSIAVSMGSFALDIYIPFVPHLSEEFGTNEVWIQYTLSIFMVFMSLGQLVIGPMSDKYGRKQLLLLSCASFIVGSLIGALTTNIVVFLVARSLQAIGACGGYAVSLACVRDSFSGQQSQRAYSYFVGINGIAPIIAPVMGTVIATAFGSWRFCFHYLALTGILAFYLIHAYLQESTSDKLKVARLPRRKEIMEVLLHRTFQRWFLVPCTVMTGLFTFFSVSTHYIQTTLAYSTFDYSLFFGFNGLVYTLGSLMNSYIYRFFSTEKIVEGAIVCLVFLSAILIAHPLIEGTPASIFFACSYLMAFIYGLINGPVTGLLLEPFSQRAGLAAALNGCIQFICAPVMVTIFIKPPITSGCFYGVIIFILSTLSWLRIQALR